MVSILLYFLTRSGQCANCCEGLNCYFNRFDFYLSYIFGIKRKKKCFEDFLKSTCPSVLVDCHMKIQIEYTCASLTTKRTFIYITFNWE